MTQPTPSFNAIARAYRWLEYCSFGRTLERCRYAQLSRVTNARRALVLGDGDGRFLTRLLAQNPALSADVVDSSAAMLALCRKRVAAIHAESRARFLQYDIREFSPHAASCYDLVVTHFFLDCLSEDEIGQLVERVGHSLRPDAQWLVSEFSIPANGPAKYIGRLLIRTLYLAFRVLTGLGVQQLPRHGGILLNCGFTCTSYRTMLFQLLRSELWQR